MKKTVASLLLLGAAVLAAPAFAEGERYPPVAHEATQKECSACHLAFQPQMLPARSWEALMNGLDNHFGENAALDAKTAEDIKAYLVANAADAAGASRWMRGVSDKDTPLRISETPRFKRAHREVSAATFQRKDIGSAANCAACHKEAAQGLYLEPGEGEGGEDD